MPALRVRDTQSRSLEVTTDAPQLPILSIVSPTPRTFTFPINHGLAAETHSPYSSPSHSPFEPDLRSLALSSSSCITPPLPPIPVSLQQPSAPIMRTLSPESAFRSSSPAASSSAPSHKRRKSSVSSDIVERRPKKGDDDYIKRPENAFILFRRKCCEDRQAALEEASSTNKKQRQADLSKTISQQWKSLSAEDRQYWEQLAKEKKKEHEQKYPDYVYRPQRAKDKEGRPKPRKTKRGDVEEYEAENITVGIPNIQRHGRSHSAPTPPPNHTIQIPNVYQMTPSCPTSPSLLPMISRRSAHPDYAEDPLAQFDYVPNDSFSFGQAGQLEASLQSSEFLRSMFSMSSLPPTDPIHPLEISHEPSMLLTPLSMVSPVSSGPSSPISDHPFTPQSALLSQPLPFSRLSVSDVSSQPQTQAELDLQIEMQKLQHQPEYAGYAWEATSLWPSDSQLLLSDDFDMGAIPPIELGMPQQKYQEHVAMVPEIGYGQVPYAEDGQSLDSILAFDEMMGGGRGF